MEKVVIVKCKSYAQKEVDKAIKKILQLLDFPTDKYKKVLIKPNVLGYYKENLEATITNPVIVQSLIKKFENAKVGESSFTDTEDSLRKTGYWKFKPYVFEEQKLIEIKDNKSKVLKHFFLPKPVKDADLIINVSKMKTHTLTKMTGAIKNLYGCIPGGMKQNFHKDAKNEKNFSSVLVDIYQNINPKLNIMDAVICMEGEGPSSGKPKKVGLLLASKNAVALDVAASKVMGLKPKKIFMIEEAVKRGLGSYKIQIVGDFKRFPLLILKKPSRFKMAMIKGFLFGMVKEKIICDENKCIKCRKCEKHCPTKSISLNPYPKINEKTCIRCFCCIEVCPEHALHLQNNKERLLKILKKLK